ncbi:MAG: DEAD/DEAH box helicase [candidate division Zixibacteria bacterium]|nr:DEAD/DEAH box helicase [candidate division Zixibacteria bacterium]
MSSTIINIWQSKQGETLLPVQDRAVRLGLLGTSEGSGDNMLICAPTSAGKSFCFEMAALKTLGERRRVVLVFPLKSLAEEKFRVLRQRYREPGVKVLIATGDHPENDRAFFRGDYQIAVTIPEKLDLLLTERLDALQNIGLVGIDEIQMLGEPGRGAILERVITRILASRYSPRLLALSAVLGHEAMGHLAGWLEAVAVEEMVRPCDLVRGVAAGGELRYRSFNDGCDGVEPFVQFEAGDPDAFGGLVEQIRKDGGSTLVFVKSRADAAGLALQLAQTLGGRSATNALAQLAGEEASFLLRTLTRVLGRGVGFHSADLSARQRRVVEQAFVEKEITVLCSTTTLSLGVNLPADTVYLETVKYASGVYDGSPELVPISRAEFDNMTGRAGRLRRSISTPGRAIVLASSAFDQEVLWDAYIAPTATVPVASSFASLPLEDWVLHVIACGLARDRQSLDAVFRRTFWRRCYPDRPLPLAGALSELIRLELVAEDGLLLPVTATGRAAARAGLSVSQVAWYRQTVEERGYPETPFGWIMAALGAPDWMLPPAFLSRYEQRHNLPVRMLYQKFDHSVEEASVFLPDTHRRTPLAYRTAAGLKAALLLDEWRQLRPLQGLEERYRIHLGQLQSLADTAAHLVAALGAVIAVSDLESEVPSMLRGLAFSLRSGVPERFESLYRRLSPVLNRSDFAALRRVSLDSVDGLVEIAQEELERVLGDPRKAQQIKDIVGEAKEEVDVRAVAVPDHSGLNGTPRLVEIDGSYEGDRYLVRINGFPVLLTGKSFKYLTKLAWSRLRDDGGWIYKEDLEAGFNQARYLYRMKNEINSSLGAKWPVVENNRMGYYRLKIDPNGIRINQDNLSDHPDYEVRQLFEVAEGSSVVS